MQMGKLDLRDFLCPCLIKPLAFQSIEECRRGSGNARDCSWNRSDKAGDAFGLQQFTTKAEERFDFSLARACVTCLIASTFREAGRYDCCGGKGEKCEPVLWIGDGKCSDWRQEEKVIQGSCHNRNHHCISQTPFCCEQQDEQQ